MWTAGMNSSSCADGPLSPPSPPDTLTPSTSKSKIRSILHWRKPSTGSLRPSTSAGHEPVPSLPPFPTHIPRPGSGLRSYSDHSYTSLSNRPRSAENKPKRKPDRVVTDPPPFAQVHRQALLHAELETPTSFTEKSRHVVNMAGDQHAGHPSENTIEVKRSHKRTESGYSICNTQEKMFFLINGPYVLQYSSDSSGDTLPEKILVLDRNSVAIACDAVPGRPWVLQISKPHTAAAKGHGQALRPSWSRITLRQPEDRRTVNNLLLVFNDSDDLYTWLFTIRKEIENLGGLRYRPDEEDDQAWREKLTQKFGPGAVSRTSSMARTTSTRASPVRPRRRGGIGNLPRSIQHSNRSSTSSKQTSTSLDRLRDSGTSDGYMSMLTTSCADGSASSTSPIYETFPSINSVTDHVHGDLSLRGFTRSDDNSPGLSTSPKQSRTLLERRKLSVSSLNLVDQEDTKDQGRRFLLDLLSTISASPDEPPSQGTNLPAHGTSDKKDVACTKTELETRKSPRSDIQKKQIVRQPSAAGSSNSGQRGKYSLFPACAPVEIKDEPLATLSTFLDPLSIPRIIESYDDSTSHTYPGTGIKHQKSGSRTLTLELRRHRVSALLGAGEFSQAQRSPAVTDDMIMQNFGIVGDEPPASPMPPTQVPRLSDLGFDMDFLRAPYHAPSKKRNPTTGSQRTSSTRSVSSSRYETSTTLARAPVGPPPARPLPAIPTNSNRSSRTSRSSHHSLGSQGERGDQNTVEEVQECERSSDPFRRTMSPLSAKISERGGQHHGQMTCNSTDEAVIHSTTHSNRYEPVSATSQSRSRSRSRGRSKSGKRI